MSHVKAQLYGFVTFPALNSERLFVMDTAGRHLVPAARRTWPSQHQRPGRAGRVRSSAERAPVCPGTSRPCCPRHSTAGWAGWGGQLSPFKPVAGAIAPRAACARSPALPRSSSFGASLPAAPRQLPSPPPGASSPPPLCLPDVTYLNQNPTRGLSTWRYTRDRPNQAAETSQILQFLWHQLLPNCVSSTQVLPVGRTPPCSRHHSTDLPLQVVFSFK